MDVILMLCSILRNFQPSVRPDEITGSSGCGDKVGDLLSLFQFSVIPGKSLGL